MARNRVYSLDYDYFNIEFTILLLIAISRYCKRQMDSFATTASVETRAVTGHYDGSSTTRREATPFYNEGRHKKGVASRLATLGGPSRLLKSSYGVHPS